MASGSPPPYWTTLKEETSQIDLDKGNHKDNYPSRIRRRQKRVLSKTTLSQLRRSLKYGLILIAGLNIFIIGMLIGFYGDRIHAYIKSVGRNSTKVAPHNKSVSSVAWWKFYSVRIEGSIERLSPTGDDPSLTKAWWEKFCDLADGGQCPDSYKNRTPLLIIGIEGFNAGYLEHHKNPVLEALKDCGVHAPYMRPAFPVETLPNLYTVITGLYPESHGFIHEINNTAYNKMVSSGGLNGEPIWMTARRHNKSGASMLWPGSDVAVNGEFPDLFVTTDQNIANSVRVNEVLKWLSARDEDRHDVFTLYIEQLKNNEDNEPDSKKLNDYLIYVDQLIYQLMEGLFQKNLLGCVNIVLISDHGVQSTSQLPKIYFDEKKNQQFLEKTEQIMSEQNPMTSNNSTELPSNVLKALDCSSPVILPLLKSDLPARLHYSGNLEAAAIIALAEPGWLVKITNMSSKSKLITYGYDNIVPNMKAIFIGYGPVFKKNFTMDPFENIELYNLFCEILELRPADNNGTNGSLSALLKKSQLKLVSSLEVNVSSPDFPDETQRFNKTHCKCAPERKNVLNKMFLMKTHLPWGVPYHSDKQILLFNEDYIISYDDKRKQPRWIAFKMNSITQIPADPCWMMDTRLTLREAITCHDLNTEVLKSRNLTVQPLFSPYHSSATEFKADAYLLSNCVLMYENFRSDIFSALRRQMGLWFVKSQKLYVILGPIFDEGSNVSTERVSSLPVPTDFFAVFIRCSDSFSSQCRLMDSIAFILPHRDWRSSCQSSKQFLSLHVARIRDIELKTNLRFFPEGNQTLALEQRMKLNEELWGGL